MSDPAGSSMDPGDIQELYPRLLQLQCAESAQTNVRFSCQDVSFEFPRLLVHRIPYLDTALSGKFDQRKNKEGLVEIAGLDPALLGPILAYVRTGSPRYLFTKLSTKKPMVDLMSMLDFLCLAPPEKTHLDELEQVLTNSRPRPRERSVSSKKRPGQHLLGPLKNLRRLRRREYLGQFTVPLMQVPPSSPVDRLRLPDDFQAFPGSPPALEAQQTPAIGKGPRRGCKRFSKKGTRKLARDAAVSFVLSMHRGAYALWNSRTRSSVRNKVQFIFSHRRTFDRRIRFHVLQEYTDKLKSLLTAKQQQILRESYERSPSCQWNGPDASGNSHSLECSTSANDLNPYDGFPGVDEESST